MDKKLNLISNEATVTIPAREYYQMVGHFAELLQERDRQVEAVKVTMNAEDVDPTISYHTEFPHALALAETVAMQIVASPEMMAACVREDKYMFVPYSSWLRKGYWGDTAYDLRRNEVFRNAWNALVPEEEQVGLEDLR